MQRANDAAFEYYKKKGKTNIDTCKPLYDESVYQAYIDPGKVQAKLFAFAFRFTDDPDPVYYPSEQPPHLMVLTRAEGGKWAVIFEGLWDCGYYEQSD